MARPHSWVYRSESANVTTDFPIEIEPSAFHQPRRHSIEKTKIMARLLITTVGTSLLTNRDDRRWAGWNRWTAKSLPNSQEVDRWLARADPVKATAETNTLQAIGIQESDHVRLLHSDTEEGRFCSERLEVFYRQQINCRAVDQRPLIWMGYSTVNFSQRGLKVLVHEAIKAVRHAREKELRPCFCATGDSKRRCNYSPLYFIQ